MLRRTAAIVALTTLVSCSSSSCPAAPCSPGISFLVSDITGAMARGGNVSLHVCLDGTCNDVPISRSTPATLFVPFAAVANDVDHDLVVSGAGVIAGEFKGRLPTYQQRASGASCGATCALASVRIRPDGTLIPGVPVEPASSTTVGGGASATTAG
jgi:hypothetical protein